MRLARGRRNDATPAVIAYVVVLAAAAVALGVAMHRAGIRPPGRPALPALPVFAALLVGSEYLFVRFKFAGETNAINLVEAVLAPLLLAFPVWVAMPLVAIAQLVASALRRNSPVKSAFNATQWALATGIGGLLLTRLTTRAGVSWGTGGDMLIVLAAIGVVNQTAFVIVLRLSHRQPFREVLRTLRPVILPGWLAGWVLNSLFGLLFLFAYAALPETVLLFPVPLVVLHLAYRGYAGARTDRVRLAGLHRAASVLAEPLDPTHAIGEFLREVASCFEARAAAIVLATHDGWTVHRFTASGGFSSSPAGEGSFERMLTDNAAPARVRRSHGGPLARALADAGWRDCLAAPVRDDGTISGALIVLDQAGLEGFEAGELAVMEALARETGATLAKGRLLTAILEERQTLSEIVTSASDGILTIAEDGTIRSWNPAMEQITGIPASQLAGRPQSVMALRATRDTGEPVFLERWASGIELPSEICIVTADGRPRRLSCSFSRVEAAGTLVVVARDVTPQEEIAALRQEIGRLAESEAAQRAIVDQLQQAVLPARPPVSGAELAVAYVASDPSSPTGGDLHDWYVLPSGELHLAVVDVLGHGVAATKDALSVVHTLRLLALEGCALEDTVARADALLGTQLVATVLVVRYDPRTGRARIASGGHPPAVHVSESGDARQIPTLGGAIGWPAAGSQAVAEIVIEPGDVLLLYTDGLVEARKDILEGTEALIAHARTLSGQPAEQLATRLVDLSLAGADRRDDSLALVLRRAPGETRTRWAVEPVPEGVTHARAALRSWLATQDVDGGVAAALQLAASELLTNAITAARTKVDLRAWIDEDAVSIEVEDDGAGRPDLDRLGLQLPPPDADVGRGLFIARAMCDELSALSTFEGTVVRVVKQIGSSVESSSVPSVS